MGTTGCPDPRIDRSPSCCCSPFECQLCCQSSNSSPAVASSISRGRNHAADRSPAVPRDRARRSLRASRRAAILRDWPAEPAPAQAGVVEPTAVLLLHCDGVATAVAHRSVRDRGLAGRCPRAPLSGAGAAGVDKAWLCSRRFARCRACRSAGLIGSAPMRWRGMLASTVIRDCHVCNRLKPPLPPPSGR